TIARVIHSAPVWNPSIAIRMTLSAIAIICLVGINLSRTTAELFYLRQPESITDSLPVSTSTKLHVSLAVRIIRTLFVGLVFVSARYTLTGEKLSLQSGVFPVIALCCLLSVVELLSAMNWVHWNASKSNTCVLIAVVMLA